jgi:hypothetical protein
VKEHRVLGRAHHPSVAQKHARLGDDLG